MCLLSLATEGPTVCKDLPTEEAATVDFGNREEVLSEDDDIFMMSLALIFDSIVPPYL